MFTNVYCKSKQALVHIYIVTGSSIAVTLEDQFKAEVTKAATVKSCWIQRCFGFWYSR
jgi:hypothetical protein